MDLIIAIACIGAFIYFLYLIAGYLDAREAKRQEWYSDYLSEKLKRERKKRGKGRI